MQTLSIINLKGGVAKTTSSVNMAHILAAVHGGKVLLIDNDKQGNASKFLNRHDYEHAGMAEIMTKRTPDMKKIIQHTDFPGLDVITANMNLLTANLKVMLDQQRPQQTRLKKALQQVSSEYDYCIIDNAPDINISTINALVASNTVMVPITIDDFAIDGLAELKEQISNTKDDLQGEEFLKMQDCNLFETHIRRTPKMKPSTFAREPIIEYSARCGASLDYKRLVEEYLKKLSENVTE